MNKPAEPEKECDELIAIFVASIKMAEENQ
jgi:hypothetical protein